MNLLRYALAAGLVGGPLAAPVQAQQQHHRPNPAPPAFGGFAVAGFAYSGASNSYIPSYLMGTPGWAIPASPSPLGPVTSPNAFPFVGIPPMVTRSTPSPQPRPGGLMLPRAAAPSKTGSTPSPIPEASAARERSGRAEELMEMGDRVFRGGNIHRAEERYQQANRAQADSPAPYVRLAQIAVVRRDYAKAANYLRDAVAAAPSSSWLLESPDVQGIFGEPGDFGRQIADLESHLQAHPQDRNAWFVLGAEQYLSGRHGQAADTLLRLTDRPADPALAAFLDATTIARRAESSHESAAPVVR